MAHDDKHVAKHENGGEDVISPANIGANGVTEKTAGGDVQLHAGQHGSVGTDPVTPVAIGAEPADATIIKESEIDTLTKLNSILTDVTLVNPDDTLEVIENIVKRIKVTGQVLYIGAVTDGEFLKRSGTNLIGDSTVLKTADIDTLAELNAIITDATLIDTTDPRLSDARAPTAHNLGGAEHNSDTIANLNSKVSDIIATYGGIRDIGIGTLAQRPIAGTANRFWWATDNDILYYDNGTTWDTINAEAEAHDLGGSEHNADTLANLNLKVSDATLIDTGDSRLSDSRSPSGVAGGDLGGTYPNPTVDDGADGSAIHNNVSGEIQPIAGKATPVDADVLIGEDSAGTWAKFSLTWANLKATLKTYFDTLYSPKLFEDTAIDSESTTTSPTFQQKLRLTTSVLPVGDYVIAWYYEIKSSNGGADNVITQVEVNDSIVLAEPFHGARCTNISPPQFISEYAGEGGFAVYPGASGTITIDIDYRTTSGTAYIRRARLSIRRVA